MISAGRGFVLVGKFTEGIFPPCKKELGMTISTLQKTHGRNYVRLHKNGVGGGGGGFVRECFCPAPIRI